MADLLKRLQISEQQYGVGMEDNPFKDASPDECMSVCFGGGGGRSPPPPPPQTVTQQTSNIPEYFQPYLERLFERAEGVTTEPFERYEGQRLALPSPQQQAAYQEPVYQEPSPKAQEWASANEWFGTDTVMTNVAFAIHNDLIQSGVDLESDEYYAQIDSRMRQELPHKFNGQTNARGNTNVQTVVSGSRTTGSGRNQNSRRVELNPSEQALARKLGVPFKEYAKQKMRLQNS